MNTEPTTHVRESYWRCVRRFTAILIAAWFVMTFGMIFFARELSAFTVFGWSLSFYMAGQGLTVFYLIIVALYMVRMQRLDKLLGNRTSDGQ